MVDVRLMRKHHDNAFIIVIRFNKSIFIIIPLK
jgi:hypothetical protein